MTDYAPPLDEIGFLLAEVVGLPAILERDGQGVTMDDVRAALAEAGRFATDVLAPLDRVGDRHGARLENGVVWTAPGWTEAYRQFAAGGWPGIAAAPAFGGQGLPQLVAAVVNELWHSANMAFGLGPTLSIAGIELLEHYGTPEQQARYLRPLVEGRWTGSMVLTEPQAGTDLGALAARAVPAEDGHYRLTGQKIFITYGDHDLTPNIIHLVLARLPDAPPGSKGISLFLVPKRRVKADGSVGVANDVRVVSLEHKLGIHASPTAVLAFGDGGGAYAELVGEPHRGLEYMFLMMNRARLAVGQQGVAVAERAWQQALAYARTRVQGRPIGGAAGMPIIGHPDVHRMLALSKARIQAMRALSYEAAAAVDRARQGLPGAQARADLLTPVVKAWCTDAGLDVVSTALQVHGGMGFIEETGIAQRYRDLRIALIYEGTNGVQAGDLVGRKLLRDGGQAFTALAADIRRGPASRQVCAALDQLERAARWLLEQGSRDPRRAAAGPTPFLTAMGTVLGGWMLDRMAAAAGAGSPMAGAARLYAGQQLPHAAALAEAAMQAADDLDAVPADWL